jgi:HlyD family secretion protein
MLNKQIQYVKKHKVLVIILLIIVLSMTYFFYHKYQTNKKSKQILYVISKVERGTIISTISGSGQVSDSNQVDLKSKVSGEITYLNLKSGQIIKEGDVLARIDSKDAQKIVRDARVSLESAQLALDKLKKSADSLSLLQAQNALDAAKESKQNTEEDIETAYEDAYTAISNTFLDMPGIMSDLDDILYSNAIGESEPSIGRDQNNSDALMNSTILDDRYKLEVFQNTAETNYNTARSKYTINFNDYKSTTINSNKEMIESLLAKTIDTVKAISQAGNSENNYLDTWSDYRTQRNLEIFSKVSDYQSAISSDISKINTHLSSLSSAQRTIQSDKDSLVSSDRTIAEKTQSLQDLISGTDPLDLKSQELSVAQKQASLNDALENLSDYTIKSPFDGIVADVSLKKGDDTSNGTSIATLITGKQIAEISLNEVDISQIKVGQKAILTFDAVSDLSITGEVVEVANIGASTSNVVSYTVKINFDTQDERIKSGMSVSASIIIDSKQDVVIVPSSVIKTKNGIKYVEMPDEDANVSGTQGVILTKTPKQQTVETGLSDDSSTEITSGLSEGNLIITKTINSSKSSSSSSSSSSKSSTNSTRSILSGDAGGPPMMR